MGGYLQLQLKVSQAKLSFVIPIFNSPMNLMLGFPQAGIPPRDDGFGISSSLLRVPCSGILRELGQSCFRIALNPNPKPFFRKILPTQRAIGSGSKIFVVRCLQLTQETDCEGLGFRV